MKIEIKIILILTLLFGGIVTSCSKKQIPVEPVSAPVDYRTKFTGKYIGDYLKGSTIMGNGSSSVTHDFIDEVTIVNNDDSLITTQSFGVYGPYKISSLGKYISYFGTSYRKLTFRNDSLYYEDVSNSLGGSHGVYFKGKKIN